MKIPDEFCYGCSQSLSWRPRSCRPWPSRSPATPGSPGATTTIDGKQLPAPDPKFGGVIKDDALQSKAWWAPRVVPPKEAPNILLIMTDDSGFGVPSTFGGVIPTPAMDRVAKTGLRYNNIHSTALCSPTRAALITGRNHHSAGFGVISEQSTGFPGYNSIIAKDKATIGRILLDNGYATSWFGKDHNTPAFAASQVGPFDQWPIGMGFEYFYGFVGGDANQWQPNLFRNTTQIYPFEGKPGWNLVTGMADDAIDYLNRINQIDPSKPFFCYYVPGATHAPHHPTKEWVDKIHDMHLFDDGWNKLRERIFENQKTPRRDPGGHQAGALADEGPQELGSTARPRRRSSSSSRSKSSPPMRPTTTTKSAASSRPSRTWASSTTRSSSTSTATTAPAPRAARSARPTKSRSSTASA